MTSEAAAYRALFMALVANLVAPLDVADRLTKRALDMIARAK